MEVRIPVPETLQDGSDTVTELGTMQMPFGDLKQVGLSAKVVKEWLSIIPLKQKPGTPACGESWGREGSGRTVETSRGQPHRTSAIQGERGSEMT